MNNQSFNTNYKIANVSKDEEKAIKKIEEELRNITKKDFVIIAWEKEQ
ncbi:hypothetical protein PN398_09330 [Romboutsia sp. 1001216sp1]|nr:MULTISPECIES: hypothetical protein [Romboutsia]MDB8790927.1 hypothetical protein [Romboutsia sp. 1001216sp1]MDB8801669.1 hypothetical protein [Romboutsia sp. 1001216sp1]MDB8813066.1 hypothetical protein [Romboutsia sp. 1001216sp1]